MNGLPHPEERPLVRPARGDELRDLASDVSGQALLVRYGTSSEGLARALAGGLSRGDALLVAEAGGLGVGLAWYQPQGTLGLGGYLRLIALRPGHEGRGLGGLLLDEVERGTALHSRHLFLLCTADNQGARRFYSRRGYHESGLLPGLVKPGLDEVLLWKRLDPAAP